MSDYSSNMATAYILLGGNIGDRHAYLQTACNYIQQLCGSIIKKSFVYETAAWGNTNQQNFYNACIAITTNFTAEQLMNCLLLIEEKMGRKRLEKYGPRTIDLDILLIDNWVINNSLVTIPHEHLPNRKFALTPLVDIAATQVHPTKNCTIEQLLTICTDNGAVIKIGAL
jgi:2-amino-4-hydroxy-6-hydroxymethyldihydropteridine diphosphokinase